MFSSQPQTTRIPRKVCLIAEVGSVHDGSFGNAVKLIEAAADAGADAVKFQTHLASTETLPDAPSPPYFKGEPRQQYFERTGFTPERWRELQAACARCHVEFLSSPFSLEAAALLEELGVARYKLGSGEISNLPLVKFLARTGKPVILSSGMSTWGELDAAVSCFQDRSQLTLLQCTSKYPCKPEQVGLNVMLEMRERYGVEVGLSDHTLSLTASIAAVALGASVVERHFAFSRLMYGSDARHSLEPAELRTLSKSIRELEQMATVVDKNALDQDLKTMKEIFEKSLVSLRAIAPGEPFTLENLGAKKPGTGLPAARLEEYVGKTARRAIAPNTLLSEADINA